LIIKRLIVGSWRANCYIAGSEATGQGLIIDPGDEAARILAAVKESGWEIKALVATHGHIDHIGAIGLLKKALGAPVAIHEKDSTALQGDSRFFWGRYFGPPMQPDRLLREGDMVSVGDLQFEVINTPGHTYGGICLYGHGALFTGDTLFRHSIGSSGIGTGTRAELLDSIMSKLLSLPEETIVYPGHGSQTTIGEEKRGNRFIRMK
jgi:hydroxyacylglutathione hydrolase